MLRGLEVEPPKTKLRSVMSISKIPTSCFNCAQIHRYNFCLSSSVSDEHTLSTLGSKPNKARAMISEPRPVQSLATLMGPVSIVFFTSSAASAKECAWPIMLSKVSLVIAGFFLGLPGGPLSFCTLKLLIFLLVKDFIQHDSTSCHGFLTQRTLIAFNNMCCVSQYSRLSGKNPLLLLLAFPHLARDPGLNLTGQVKGWAAAAACV